VSIVLTIKIVEAIKMYSDDSFKKDISSEPLQQKIPIEFYIEKGIKIVRSSTDSAGVKERWDGFLSIQLNNSKFLNN
jgi:hypothetical protein